MATIFDEFSQEATAFINPSDCVRPLPGFPEICMTTFSQNIITEFVTNHNIEVVFNVFKQEDYNIYKAHLG